MTDIFGHVLVVEDNPALLAVIALHLKKAGLTVTTANTGSEAWRNLEEDEFDLVVTDFNMPGMSGGDLCAKMRNEPRHQGIPVVMLTGLSEDFQREHSTGELGVACVIRKPFSPRDVTARVLELLEQARLPSPELQ